MGSHEPSLLGIVLIALVGGWLALRLMHRRGRPFAALEWGVGGVLLAATLASLLGLPMGGTGGVMIAAFAGAALLVWLWTHRPHRRNHGRRDEFDSGG